MLSPCTLMERSVQRFRTAPKMNRLHSLRNWPITTVCVRVVGMTWNVNYRRELLSHFPNSVLVTWNIASCTYICSAPGFSGSSSLTVPTAICRTRVPIRYTSSPK